MNAETIRPSAERNSLKKKILTGAGLAGGDWALSRVIDGVSIAGAASGVMEPLIKSHPMVVLGLIAGTFTFAAGLNAFQNMRLLRNDDIGVSTNGIATGAFHVVDKKLPLKRKLLRKLSMGAIGFGQVFSKEHLLIGPAALGNEMALGGLVANTALKTPFNLVKAVASEVALRVTKREKRIKESKHKDLRSSDTIFQAQRVPVPVVAGD